MGRGVAAAGGELLEELLHFEREGAFAICAGHMDEREAALGVSKEGSHLRHAGEVGSAVAEEGYRIEVREYFGVLVHGL